jgi:DNA-binding response OmpR family regulator
VVDDDADVGDLVALWLRGDGHTVFLADSAGAALTLADRHGVPDAVVLDVAMPGVDGVDLLGQLRSRFGRLPAVFLTVLWTAQDLARMRETGAEYLSKPCTADELRAVVRRLVREVPGGGEVGSA